MPTSSRQPSARPPRRTPPGAPAPAGPSGGVRAVVERVSLPALIRISRWHRAVPFVVLLAVLVTAVFVGGGVAVAGTALVVLVVGWLAYLGWPRLTGSERLGRVAVLAVAVALCLVQAFPPG